MFEAKQVITDLDPWSAQLIKVCTYCSYYCCCDWQLEEQIEKMLSVDRLHHKDHAFDLLLLFYLLFFTNFTHYNRYYCYRYCDSWRRRLRRCYQWMACIAKTMSWSWIGWCFVLSP